jgi:xanthine dehydrogenase molybdenum-binding subunit
MMAEYRHIGKESPRIAAWEMLTGRAKYARDVKVPRMLYGKVLRSPYAYAKIISIDASEALALPGVEVVLTYKNSPEWRQGMPLPHKRFLCDTARFIGDAVALVAAQNEQLAEDALDLIKVEYEPMKPVLSIDEALSPDAPRLYPELPGNKSPLELFGQQHLALTDMCYGDVEKGFSEADVIVENVSKAMNGQNPLPPEAPGVIAEWEGEYLTVRGALSSVGLCKLMCAPIMNIAISDMRVIATYVGGSYGTKHFSSVGSPLFYAAALAKATNRPVAMFLSKEEHFTAHTVRLNSKAKYKIGLKKDGTVTAIQGEWLCECGAFSGEQGMMIGVGMISQAINAKSENADVKSTAVVTNRTTSGAFRGYGYLENCIHICNALYKGLEKIDLDPVEYYRRNSLTVGDKFFHAYMCIGMDVCAGPDFTAALNAGADAFHWNERWKGFGKPTETRGHIVRAVGMGISGQSDVGEQAANENIHLIFDGGVTVSCAATEFGPGIRDVVRKVAAEALNVSLDRVRISPPDSMAAPYEWGSTGSRSTYAMGNAVLMACEDAKKKLFEKASRILQCPPEALETKDGMVSIIGHPEATVPWVAAIGFNECITGVGNFKGAYNVVSSQAQFVEIELDKETGKVTVLEHICSTDCGQVVNPLALKGQLDGYFPGLDIVIREETVWDHEGRMLTANMIDYKTRTWNEVPKHSNIVLETRVDADPPTPFGAFGGGEPSLAPAIPAVTLALYNATGVWFNEYPVTPDVILNAIQKGMGRHEIF